MRPFNLEEALAGKPVTTRDGKSVRIICIDRKHLHPVVALVEATNGSESIIAYTTDGEYFENTITEHHLDLVMAPTKRSAWLNIYSNGDTKLHKTKYDADQATRESRTACIPIEWEE